MANKDFTEVCYQEKMKRKMKECKQTRITASISTGNTSTVKRTHLKTGIFNFLVRLCDETKRKATKK